MSYLQGIDETGQSPYKIAGDPVTALVAQVNRFAGKTLPAGGSCGARKLVPTALPLGPVITPQGAHAAALVLWHRYDCVPVGVKSASKLAWAANGLFQSDTAVWSFVMNNLQEITLTLASFADSLGYDPATIGITQRDPRMAPKLPIGTIAIIGVLAIGALLVSRRAR